MIAALISGATTWARRKEGVRLRERF